MTEIPTAAEVVALLGLEPLPVEGGLFVQTWRTGPAEAPVGTATYMLLTDDPDSFSAMHRLAADEIWHHYLGDAVELLLLHPDGSASRPRLGSDLRAGERPQIVVPAGVWMGARVAPGGRLALFGNTMAPGFHSGLFDGADPEALCARWPAEAARIRSLVRPDAPRAMPPGL